LPGVFSRREARTHQTGGAKIFIVISSPGNLVGGMTMRQYPVDRFILNRLAFLLDRENAALLYPK